MSKKLGLLIQRIMGMQVVVPERNERVANMIEDLNKKVKPKHYEKMFRCFRYTIENLLADGYTCQAITDEDRAAKQRMQDIFNALKDRPPMTEWPYDPKAPPITLDGLAAEYKETQRKQAEEKEAKSFFSSKKYKKEHEKEL